MGFLLYILFCAILDGYDDSPLFIEFSPLRFTSTSTCPACCAPFFVLAVELQTIMGKRRTTSAGGRRAARRREKPRGEAEEGPAQHLSTLPLHQLSVQYRFPCPGKWFGTPATAMISDTGSYWITKRGKKIRKEIHD